MKTKKISSTAKERITFLKQVLSKKKDYTEALSLLGDLYTRSGRIRSGYKIDRQLVYLQPVEPFHYYNLACDCALLGKKDEAMMYLEIAIILGFDDFEHISKDPDLECIRKEPGYEKVVREVFSRRIK